MSYVNLLSRVAMLFVSLCAAELQEGFLSVVSVALHATAPPGGLQAVVSVAQLPCVQRNYWDAFMLWSLQGSRQAQDQFLSCPVCSGAPGMAHAVVSDALSAADLLGCLRMWYFQRNRLAERTKQKRSGIQWARVL